MSWLWMLKIKESMPIKLRVYIFIGFKRGNSQWAVEVVWVRNSLLSPVHLASLIFVVLAYL